jgi:ribonuclease HI
MIFILPDTKTRLINEMELKACVLVLEEIINQQLTVGKTRIIIRTDSLYVANNYKKAMFEWSKNRWFRQSGAPVANAEIWNQLLKAMKRIGIRVDIEWVRGHSKDEHNIAVDRMARQSARMAVQPPISLVHVRRKLSDEEVETGCVKMSGQRIFIRIITAKYLGVQKLWKCKYEVITKSSEHYLSVDIIYSSKLLKAGHSYFVQFNDEQDNPRVVRVFREIKDN